MKRPLDDKTLPLMFNERERPVSDEVIFAQKSFTSAVALAVNISGLEEKEIYLTLGIDAGHWTRIMKGDAHFPVNKLNDLCDLTGNEIPLIWWANSRGKGLHMLKSEAERRAEEAEKRAQEAEQRLAWLTELLQGKK